jgi:hypothetical protein
MFTARVHTALAEAARRLGRFVASIRAATTDISHMASLARLNDPPAGRELLLMRRSFWILTVLLPVFAGIPQSSAAERDGANPEKAKAIAKLLRDLRSACGTVPVGPLALEDLAALTAAVAMPNVDAELLAAVEQMTNRLVQDVVVEAASKPKLLAAAGQKQEALVRIDAMIKAFASSAAATQPLQEAKGEIENDKPGVILGEYWRGAALGSAYYTGPGARDAKWFEAPSQKIGKELNLPFLEIHAAHITGNAGNENGVLLYPDGTARCRFLLLPGGDPGTVMKEIGKEGCEKIRKAFNTGMNYMGICSGCCLASEFCFKLWPGKMTRKNPVVKGPPHDIVMWPFHPLARLRKGGAVLKEVAFTGGINEMTAEVPNTEYIGFFKNGKYEGMEGNCALMAYSPPGYGAGRLVVCPAHPEAKEASFLLLMCEYSLRHKYALPRNPIQLGTPVKGICGDHQNQYYELRIPEGSKRVDVTLADLDGECELFVKFGEPPRPKNDPIMPGIPPGKRDKKSDKKATVSVSKPGLCFIMIHGSHDIPNGANYTLSATVDTGGK